MLSTGIKTPVGIKIMGPDLKVLSDLAEQDGDRHAHHPRAPSSAYPERSFGGYYLDIDIDRAEAARYGLTIGDVQDVIRTALGGMNVTTTVEGLERYPLNVRYARTSATTFPRSNRSWSPRRRQAPGIAQVPLGQLAKIHINPGPPMIRSENAQRTAWVFVDIAGRAISGGYIAEARDAVAKQLQLPPGTPGVFSGQFEFWEKTVPQARRRECAHALRHRALALRQLRGAGSAWPSSSWPCPSASSARCWFLYVLGYNLSLAVVIGMIALAGLDAETGLVMLLYLDNSFERFDREGRMKSRDDLWEAVHDGAVQAHPPQDDDGRGGLHRPGAAAAGPRHRRRRDAPPRRPHDRRAGRSASSMELVVYPVVFYIVKGRQLGRQGAFGNELGLG